MPSLLIIEDEEKIARFLELELTHEGYTVVTAQITPVLEALLEQ